MNVKPENFSALLAYLKKWDDFELTFAGGGSHKRPDGGYLVEAEIYLYIDVPNGDEVQKIMDVLKDGQDFVSEEADSEPDADEASPAQDQSQTAQTDQES